jgi:hypothetical protein
VFSISQHELAAKNSNEFNDLFLKTAFSAQIGRRGLILDISYRQFWHGKQGGAYASP